jgi:ATP-dependent RNA helicase DBP3
MQNGITEEGNNVVVANKKKDRKKKKEKEKKDPVSTVKRDESDDQTTGSHESTAILPEVERKLSKEERKAAKKVAKEAVKRASKSTAQLAGASTAASPIAIATATYTQSTELTAIPQLSIDSFIKEHSISIDDPHASNLRPITEFSYLPPNSFDFSKFKIPSPIQAATWPFTLSWI